MDRKAKAQWKGDLRTGTGTISSNSGVLSNTPYSFRDRFEHGTGTNPEELLGAAHAGCFSMALAFALTKGGTPPEHIHTKAKVHFGPNDGGFAISRIDEETARETYAILTEIGAVELPGEESHALR